MSPNNSFKPKLLRSGNGVAKKACHAVACATQFGLTQQLSCDLVFQAMMRPSVRSSSRRPALTIPSSLRMHATSATLPSFPRFRSCW